MGLRATTHDYIPSLINLAIGGTALMRAIPGVSPLLLRFLPATGGVPTYDRAWIAAVLTLQELNDVERLAQG